MNSKTYISTFVLKLIAIVSVFIDHFAVFFVSSAEFETLYFVLRGIGRIGFILYAFFAFNGALKSKNPNKYFLRIIYLLIVILLIQVGINFFVPKDLLVNTSVLEFGNIFITLLAGSTLVYYLYSKKFKHIYYLIPSIYVVTTSLINALSPGQIPAFYLGDYGLYGLVTIVSFYIAYLFAGKYLLSVSEKTGIDITGLEMTDYASRIRNYTYAFAILFVNVVFYILSISNVPTAFTPFQSYALIAIIPLLFYNGRLGYTSKPFKIIYYLFYPVHIGLLFLISLL